MRQTLYLLFFLYSIVTVISVGVQIWIHKTPVARHIEGPPEENEICISELNSNYSNGDFGWRVNLATGRRSWLWGDLVSYNSSELNLPVPSGQPRLPLPKIDTSFSSTERSEIIRELHELDHVPQEKSGDTYIQVEYLLNQHLHRFTFPEPPPDDVMNLLSTLRIQLGNGALNTNRLMEII